MTVMIPVKLSKNDQDQVAEATGINNQSNHPGPGNTETNDTPSTSYDGDDTDEITTTEELEDVTSSEPESFNDKAMFNMHICARTNVPVGTIHTVYQNWWNEFYEDHSRRSGSTNDRTNGVRKGKFPK